MATNRKKKRRGRGYRGIPQPAPNIPALQQTVEALLENVEVLLGQRGAQDDAAATVGELRALGRRVDDLQQQIDDL